MPAVMSAAATANVTATTLSPSSLVARAIEAYQRFVSPYKGFCCAHRCVHGRDSCSQFAKRVVVRRGVLRMVPLLMRRFTECGVAAQVLDYEARERKRQRAREPQRRSGYAHWSPSCWDADDTAECCTQMACEGLADGGLECACDSLAHLF
jgi:putative component of membrane protein insertase Oxa1/YidC/SpoIIIJ protein YidD